jgi:hypothetical protein
MQTTEIIYEVDIQFYPPVAKKTLGASRIQKIERAINGLANAEARRGAVLDAVSISAGVQTCTWNRGLGRKVFMAGVSISVDGAIDEHSGYQARFWTNHPDDSLKTMSILGSILEADSLHRPEVMDALVEAVVKFRVPGRISR